MSMQFPTCDECGERPANVFLKKVEGEHVAEINLCETCAKQNQATEEWGLGLSFGKLIAGIVGETQSEAKGEPLPPPGTQPACSACGLDYTEFVRGGRFGCEACYEAFAEALPSLLGEVQQGNAEHRGRVPPALRERKAARRTLAEVRGRLESAVRAEEYEVAAQLRDEIRELEKGAGVAAHASV